ncbi:MAG: hypothetical protein ACYTE6_00855, partial [Planctomycetota bacterium]
MKPYAQLTALTGSPSPASARRGPPAAAVGVLCLLLAGCAASSASRRGASEIPADVRTALSIHQGQ